MTATFDARRTGWTVEKCLSELAEYDDDPYRHVYYATYADNYHTDPDCPHIQDSENLHLGNSVHDFAAPWCLGNRVPRDLDECSWCASRTDWKFTPEYREPILGRVKRATIRPGSRAAKVSEGDTIVFRSTSGETFGTAPVTAVEQRAVAEIVRDGITGHHPYESVEAFRTEFSEYYPDREFSGASEVSVLGWGRVTSRPED